MHGYLGDTHLLGSVDCIKKKENVFRWRVYDPTEQEFRYILEYFMINLAEYSFCVAVFAIIACPLIWNLLARLEYHTHIITRLFGGPQQGCYALAFWIFITSLLRDFAFRRAIHEQPTSSILQQPVIYVLGKVLCYVGLILVISSFLRLGIVGTYLGDYFGILMDHKVTAFPFNILSHPMYVGATIAFLGESMACQSLAGLLLTTLIGSAYYIASIFEGSFTERIYSEKIK